MSDNVTYTSATNRFSSLISGVNIDVAATTGEDTVHLSTKRNTDTFTQSLREIVKGYNSFLTSITDEIRYDVDIAKRGGLANDPVTRDFMRQMQRLTTSPISGYLDRSVTMAEVGVRTNRDGSLMIDEAVLARTIENHPEVLEAVVSSNGSSKGVLDRMRDLTDKVIAPKSDFVNLYDKTSGEVITSINDEIAKLDDRMDALQSRYLKQFTTMQAVLTESDSYKGTLTSFMESWTASLKNG